MKTIKSYSEEIRTQYEEDKKKGKLYSDLYVLKPGVIRSTCLHLEEDQLSNEDLKVLENFFNCKKEFGLRKQIKKHDIDLFKPICNFLKQETKSLKANDSIELIAVLIDFQPRPYRHYLNSSAVKIEPKKRGASQQNRKSILKEEAREGKKKKEKPKSNPITKLIASIVLVVLGYIGYSLGDKKCMEWKGDHYEKVYCSGNDKQDSLDMRILRNFKQVFLKKCDTFFIDENPKKPKIWYDKSNNKVTLFTTSGIHPTNDKTLKPITPTIIDGHLDPCEIKE